jgi:hypothetical protein
VNDNEVDPAGKTPVVAGGSPVAEEASLVAEGPSFFAEGASDASTPVKVAIVLSSIVVAPVHARYHSSAGALATEDSAPRMALRSSSDVFPL